MQLQTTLYNLNISLIVCLSLLYIGEFLILVKIVNFFLPEDIRLRTYTWKDFCAFVAFSTKQKSISRTPTASKREMIYLNVHVTHSFWGIRSVANVCGVIRFWNLLHFFSYFTKPVSFTLLKKAFWEHTDKLMDKHGIFTHSVISFEKCILKP